MAPRLWQQSQPSQAALVGGAWSPLVLAVLAVLAAIACGPHAAAPGVDGAAGAAGVAPAAGSAASEPDDVARARVLASGGSWCDAAPSSTPTRSRWPSRSKARAVQGRELERAPVDLHATAAHLLERVWRVDGRDRDAAEAMPRSLSGGGQRTSRPRCLRGRSGAPRGSRVTSRGTRPRRTPLSIACKGEEFHPARCGAQRGRGGPPRRAVVSSREDSLTSSRSVRRAASSIRSTKAWISPVRAPAAPRGLRDGGSRSPPSPASVRIESWPGRDAARVVVVLDRSAPYRVGDEVLSGQRSAPHVS